MNIAFFHYHQQTQNRGVETYIKELTKRLKHHTVKIFSHPNPILDSRSRLSLLQRLYLDRLSLNIGAWTMSELRNLTNFSPDVVISLNSGWQVLILRLFTYLKGIKLIVPGQSGPGWDDRFNLFCHPDVFVCLTQSQLKWAKKATLWRGQQFSVIPNGVDVKKFSQTGPKAKLKLKHPIILIVGAAEENKRVEQGIKAVSKLKNVSLLWIGSGALEQKLELIGDKLLGDRFLHLRLPYQEIPKYYRAADLFTLCSETTEAFGIVYLEALASGLPVVATDDSQRREILGDNALYVKDPGNPNEYASVLKMALKHPPKIQSSAVKRFSWDTIAKSYQNLFKSK